MFEIEGKRSMKLVLPPIERPKSQQAPKPKKVYPEVKRPTTAIDRLKMMRKLQRLNRTTRAFEHKSTYASRGHLGV
jgi:hypothetical protein